MVMCTSCQKDKQPHEMGVMYEDDGTIAGWKDTCLACFASMYPLETCFGCFNVLDCSDGHFQNIHVIPWGAWVENWSDSKREWVVEWDDEGKRALYCPTCFQEYVTVETVWHFMKEDERDRQWVDNQ